MPWFVVDDNAHNHPKVLRAGNAAYGLWVRCGSYVAQHLTDGFVPGELAALYGSEPQIRKLCAAGLWHASGHGCSKCPQPRQGDYYMHDYRESGNPSRAEVLAKRKRAADKKRAQREGSTAREGRRPDGPGENLSLFSDDSSSFLPRIDEEKDLKKVESSDVPAGHSDVSRGDSLGTSRARAFHSTPLHKEGGTERESPTGSGGRTHERTLSLIPADWQPDEADIAAAQAARTDAGREALTEQQLAAVTRKFVRRMTDDRTHAAAWGGRWQQWAEGERVEPATGVVVPLNGSPAQPQTRGQQQRAGLARLLQQRAGEA